MTSQTHLIRNIHYLPYTPGTSRTALFRLALYQRNTNGTPPSEVTGSTTHTRHTRDQCTVHYIYASYQQNRTYKTPGTTYKLDTSRTAHARHTIDQLTFHYILARYQQNNTYQTPGTTYTLATSRTAHTRHTKDQLTFLYIHTSYQQNSVAQTCLVSVEDNLRHPEPA